MLVVCVVRVCVCVVCVCVCAVCVCVEAARPACETPGGRAHGYRWKVSVLFSSDRVVLAGTVMLYSATTVSRAVRALT